MSQIDVQEYIKESMRKVIESFKRDPESPEMKDKLLEYKWVLDLEPDYLEWRSLMKERKKEVNTKFKRCKAFNNLTKSIEIVSNANAEANLRCKSKQPKIKNKTK
jgi:hypothetical protein